jgi:hypothetical protein
MPGHSGQPDDAKIAANLRRAIELTELGLRLRRAVLQQKDDDRGHCLTSHLVASLVSL